MDIKCIIFDCDGTMFDTERIARTAWNKIFADHNITVADDFFDHITGGGKKELNRMLEANPKIEAVLPQISEYKHQILEDELKNGNINKKGLLELINYLKTSNLKVCVASSSKIDYVQHLVNSLDTDFKFDFIIGGDQVKQAKPDPELFLRAAKQVQVLPEHCLVLEDSKNGIKAAIAAKMHHVFIKDLIEPDNEMKNMLEFTCDDLSNVIALIENNNK